MALLLSLTTLILHFGWCGYCCLVAKSQIYLKWWSNLCFLQASFVGAMAIADLVKTTLGPKGMVSTLLCCKLEGFSSSLFLYFILFTFLLANYLCRIKFYNQQAEGVKSLLQMMGPLFLSLCILTTQLLKSLLVS